MTAWRPFEPCAENVRAADLRLCRRCLYPFPQDYDGPRIKLKSGDLEVERILETARRAAKEVASWPAWKAGECRCKVEM